MFGMYTTSKPAMMQTDKTEATLRTRSVPKIATMKINAPISSVHSRYGRPGQRAQCGARRLQTQRRVRHT